MGRWLDSLLNSSDLEKDLKKFLIGLKPKSKIFLLAVSGGLDSAVLMKLFIQMQNKFGFKVVVAHIFHGPSQDKAMMKYRKTAYKVVRDTCNSSGIAFVSNSVELSSPTTDDLGQIWPNSSEESLRSFRIEGLRKLKALTGADYVVFAHHRDDLLETRLMRLIRGVGQGGLKAMRRKSKVTLRPFLNFWREDLESIARVNKIKYAKDPSNLDQGYFRNWIRVQWLPQLERFQPGAKKSLVRSLENLSVQPSATAGNVKILISDKGVDRAGLLALEYVEQRQILATYFRQTLVASYSSSHIDEVLKRLRTPQKNFEFKVAGRVWIVTENHLSIRSV